MKLLQIASFLLAVALLSSCATPLDSFEQNESAMAAYLKAQANLPIIERSDWVNVKTDVTPAAVGDGIADDTAAIKKALSMIQGKRPSAHVVYFPPGKYRITSTLSVREVQGGALYGHGRATVLIWDGAKATKTAKSNQGATVYPGPRMFHSDGFGRNLYFGITFDGANKAAVGVDHQSSTYYETRVRYQYCAFRNFLDSGVRVGYYHKTPSAEMMYFDCLFENCKRGVSFLEFNDYDNVFARCIFRNCGSGIYCHRGNVYVHDCHFEKSRNEDLLLPPHSHSVRRCTSIGSKTFIRPAQNGGHPFLLSVQDCHISAWTDKDAAIQLINRGPALIFDTIFANPVHPSSNAIHLANDKKWEQTLLTANLQSQGVAKMINPGKNGIVTSIPRTRPEMLIVNAAGNRWHHRPDLPTKIFDAKVDFAASGTGTKDDTKAIQATIDAAQQYGKGAMAYLPCGNYAVSKTLKLGSGDYFFGGPLGWRTNLKWTGKAKGTVLHSHNASNLRICQLKINVPKKMPAIGLLTTADQAGKIVCDGLFSGGAWQPEFLGTVFKDLPKGFTVRAPHIDSDTTINNCGNANILLSSWYAGYNGPLTITGGTGDGFTGINSIASSLCNPDLKVTDSSSIVVGDYYTEQTHQALQADGKPGQKPGRITISYAKLGCKNPEKIKINGYSGQISINRANMMYFPTTFVGNGGKNCKLLLLGNSFNPIPPKFKLKDIALFQVGCNVWNYKDKSQNCILPNSKLNKKSIKAINSALDHFSELSYANLDFEF